MADETRFQNQEKRLRALMERDLAKLAKKEREYDRSWQKRGGSGAFHNTDRKWDRYVTAVGQRNWDVFLAIQMDPREDGILDDIRDLRSYLYLIEEEVMHRGIVPDILPRVSKTRKPGDVIIVDKTTPNITYTESSDWRNRDNPTGYDPALDNPPGDWTCLVCGDVYAACDEDLRHRVDANNSICHACRVGEEMYSG